MRAFVAVNVPADVQRALGALQRDLAASGADVTWVRPEQVHLTLKFLDDISNEQRQGLEALLARLAASEPSFRIALETVGAFPSVDAPQVLWVGVGEGREPLTRLAEGLEQGSAAWQVRREPRPFTAHATIGRVRSGRCRRQLADRLRASAWPPPPPWPVRSLTFYRSDLSAAGPTHTVLADCPLSPVRGASAG